MSTTNPCSSRFTRVSVRAEKDKAEDEATSARTAIESSLESYSYGQISLRTLDNDYTDEDENS